MDIRVLRYFLAVAREGNITKAAKSLHIAQPSLSKQLMELEEELGKQLLIRGKRKISLTEEGILLRKRAEEIVHLMEKTECEIRSDEESVVGEVSIGGGSAGSILESAAQLREKYPDIQFHFFHGDETDMLERLDHGSLDFAVLIEPVDTLKYEYISLPETAVWGLLMKSDGSCDGCAPVRKDEIFGMPLVIHKREGLQRELELWADCGIDALNVAGTYNMLHGNPDLSVKSGLGNVLTTDDQAETGIGGDICFRPLEPELKIRYALVWKRYPVFHKAANAFLGVVKSKLS